MPGYKEKDNSNTSLNLMGRRLGVFYQKKPTEVGHKPDYLNIEENQTKELQSILDPELIGIDTQRILLEINGNNLNSFPT